MTNQESKPPKPVSAATLKTELRRLHSVITERKAYLKQQEDLIARAVEEGNLTLKSLQYQIDDLENTKQAITLEIAQLNTDRRLLEDEIIEIHDRSAMLEDQYEARATSLKNTIKKEIDKLEEVTRQSKHIVNNMESREKSLEEREAKLVAAEVALKNSRRQLEKEKQAWSSTKSIYDL